MTSHHHNNNIVDTDTSTITPPTSNRSGSISFSSSATDPTATTSIHAPPTASSSGDDNNGRRVSLADVNPSSQHPARDVSAPINPATESSPLNPHHRPSVQGDDHQGLKGETTIRQMSRAQNAPGRAGDIGENVVGMLGFGGSSVERPREEQVVGEKIVEFLGV